MDHRVFWTPSLTEYWNTPDPEKTHAGFPCFIALLYRSVNSGEEGDEDPEHILDNVLYTYPGNIPNHFLQALVGGLVTFTTFSRLNLGSLLTSFSWSQSTIAVESIPLTDGNYIVFALKMPKFFSPISVKNSIHRTIQALKFINQELNEPMSTEVALSLRTFFKTNSLIIHSVGFPQKIDDAFDYAARPLSAQVSKAATCLATQLFEFARHQNPNIVGSAMFTKTEFILSEIKEPLLDLLQMFGSMASRAIENDTGRFYSFPLYINPFQLKWTDDKKENNVQKFQLSVVSWNSVIYYVLIKDVDNLQEILAKLLALLSNGISDFSVECETGCTKEKIDGLPAVVYWPLIAASKQSASCDPAALSRMAAIHDQFASHKTLKEISILQNGRYITGVSMLKVEMIVEVKGEPGKPFINESYARIKELVPNLPQDLSKL